MSLLSGSLWNEQLQLQEASEVSGETALGVHRYRAIHFADAVNLSLTLSPALSVGSEHCVSVVLSDEFGGLADGRFLAPETRARFPSMPSHTWAQNISLSTFSSTSASVFTAVTLEKTAYSDTLSVWATDASHGNERVLLTRYALLMQPHSLSQVRPRVDTGIPSAARPEADGPRLESSRSMTSAAFNQNLAWVFVWLQPAACRDAQWD